jgi:beta-glucosidase
MGNEFRVKGVNVALGPVAGPLGRVVLGGRNWEGFGSDPYLSGKLCAESVLGTQEMGVITSVKHLIANEVCHLHAADIHLYSLVKARILEKSHSRFGWPRYRISIVKSGRQNHS